MINVNRFVPLSLLALFIAPAAHASEPRMTLGEVHFQTHIQKTLPEFRIVKSFEPFPERINASVEVNVDTSNHGRYMKSLVTLYEDGTGAPLESCYTPCILHKALGQTVHIYAYRLGHIPMPYRISTEPSAKKIAEPNWNGVYKFSLGPDYRRVYFKTITCDGEFEARLETDGDATPCHRSPPVMPRIDYSGYCKMGFDVSNTGDTINVKATKCSDPIFEAPSIITASSWKYYPKVEQGIAVMREGFETKIRFDITDYDGHLLDENGDRVGE